MASSFTPQFSECFRRLEWLFHHRNKEKFSYTIILQRKYFMNKIWRLYNNWRSYIIHQKTNYTTDIPYSLLVLSSQILRIQRKFYQSNKWIRHFLHRRAMSKQNLRQFLEPDIRGRGCLIMTSTHGRDLPENRLYRQGCLKGLHRSSDLEITNH